MSRILLGVSGGVAAYKALEFIRLATGAGHLVRVILTPAAERFVGRASFEALSGAPALISEFERDPLRGAFPGEPPPAHTPISHLELVAKAELLLVAPATANTLAKLAHGHADNLLSSAALAARCPLLVAPAMNNRMYEHPATRANLELLRARGVELAEPGAGRLASVGEEGIGRLAEPAALLERCEALLGAGAREWRGLHVLVTAGGTREPIDSVRYLGNRSSGRMGLELARAAHRRGAQVVLVAANVSLASPDGVARRDVTTTAELQRVCEEEFERCELLLMSAAVADYRPAAPAAGKLKKAGRERVELELEATPDVLSGLAARRRPGQTLVGFAAEHGPDAVALAREKLALKGLDALVVNDISRSDIGFDAQDNEVTVLTSAQERHVPRAAKAAVAEAILDVVAALRAEGA